jgi:hypothetical protein
MATPYESASGITHARLLEVLDYDPETGKQSSQGYRFIQAVRENTYKWVLVFERVA